MVASADARWPLLSGTAERARRAIRLATPARHAHPPMHIWVPAVLVAVGMALPLVYLMLRTATAGSHALELLLRLRTLQLLVGTAGLAAAVTAATVAIAVPLAFLTTRTDLPLRRLWSVLTVLPLAIPTYVGGFVLVTALGPKGLLQAALEPLFGVKRLPEIYGFPGALLALTLFTYPYVLLSVRAALERLDPSLEEVSRSLGHGRRLTFFRVTLPLLRPAIASGALLVALYTLSDFGAVSLLQFESFTQAIYVQYRGSFDRTLAAVFALLLVGLTMVVTVVEARSRGRGRYHRTGLGAARRASPIRLGHWRWPALAFCAGVVGVALALPVGVLVYWFAQGLSRGSVAAKLGTEVWQLAVNSVYASALAALVTVAAALPVAILVTRYPGRLAALTERLAYSGFALPGIVVALALVFFSANYALPLYQTLALLVLGYAARFLPQAVGAARSSLLQVTPRVEEVARSLGRGQAGVLWSVTLPLVSPGVIAGAALVFLTTIKELPMTLLLSPIGFKTLATSIWTSTSEGLFAEAAVPALLLVLVSALSMALLNLGGRSSAS